MRRTYNIDIDCANCARCVEEAIAGVEGVEEVSVVFVEKKMYIEIPDDRFDEVMGKVDEAAHKAEDEFRYWPAEEEDGEDEEEDEDEDRYTVPKILIGLLFVAIGLVFEYLYMPDVPELWIRIVFLVALIGVGWNVYLSGIRNLVKGGFLDEHFLMTVATLAAVAIGYYTESVAVMTFYLIGEWFEDRAVDSSRRDVRKLIDLKAVSATVIRDGQAVQVQPSQVAVGDVLLVQPGEMFPVDGAVIEGEGFADTKALTGEPKPRRISPGDGILGGFVNGDAAIRIRAEKRYDDSANRRLLALIEESSARKSRSEKFITRFAKVYTPAVVALALIMGAAGGLITKDWDYWITNAIIFLVVSCPCALVVSIPLSYYCGIGGASRNGILVKGATYIEALSKTGTVVFDKTGTLTEGVFAVRKVEPAEGYDAETVIEHAAQAEMFSTHPIAVSIIRYAGERPDTTEIEDSVNVPGKGMTALVDSVPVFVGSRQMLEEFNVAGVPERDEGAGTFVHVAIGGKYAGRIVLQDSLREDSAAAVSGLRTMGIGTRMFTGDTEDTARAVASELGVDGYRSEMLPEDKIRQLEDTIGETTGNVAFVGDGINDSPSLARQDVGIAMGNIGSDAAVEAADVVIIDDSPSKVPMAIRVGRRTQGIVKQNIVLGLAAKFGIMLFTPLGFVNMWIAIFGDVGVLVICVLNATRAMGKRPRDGRKGRCHPSA